MAETKKDKGAIRIYSIPKNAAIIWSLLFFIVSSLCYVLTKQNTSFVPLISEFTTINYNLASNLDIFSQIAVRINLLYSHKSENRMSFKKFDFPESPIQIIEHPLLAQKQVILKVKRDDLLHPHIAGNKWRKLKYNLIAMQQQNKSAFITFSGPFSNHLYAASMACKLFALEGHAIVRGPHLDIHNPTIRMARACGVQLHTVDRATYRLRHNDDYLMELQQRFAHCHIIPEGGSNQQALVGVQELANSLPKSDYVMCATGSGGTLAGLINASSGTTSVIGIAVLKQAEYLIDEIIRLAPKAKQKSNWQLMCDFHDGGYGKFSTALWQFCKMMKKDCKLPLEPIYTGKLFYALWQLLEQDFFAPGSHITAIHTGGLQGLDGLRYRQLITN
ncbi:D-cysteine desulfhydrase [Pseudoalteromonas holothuriae]|uniref:D-cysteine desulfhydrase n=2 Tax=Pseudoalteromonas holothuriae TaxID=2963714 RepID=A0ABM9GLJ1_9GAMM|nr:D-cysteine desulfhydrase [Pseudoalteromonas sp. CIP111951]